MSSGVEAGVIGLSLRGIFLCQPGSFFSLHVTTAVGEGCGKKAGCQLIRFPSANKSIFSDSCSYCFLFSTSLWDD